jgi:translation elongation factor EF-Tu-like GTPase
MPTEEMILEEQEETFAIDTFLVAEAAKDLLRFSTAGSVDDGKSTLIGRLLYDSRNVYEDQVRAVTGLQAGQKQLTIDFALLTDGLRAEMEQGITIDVAYRYFATQRRKFIIADTPGHEQYTRNMATGASTAHLAIILIDGRKGILPQSRRHAHIASLLGIRHLAAVVNKMDLVGFSEEVYRTISRDFSALVKQYGGAELVMIPVSALEGDNVVEPSTRMAWYDGPTLLAHLETVPVWTDVASQPFRLPVQRVIRPDQSYRGFAGQIASGTIRKGDTIVAQPSGRTTRVASITTFDGDMSLCRSAPAMATYRKAARPFPATSTLRFGRTKPILPNRRNGLSSRRANTPRKPSSPKGWRRAKCGRYAPSPIAPSTIPASSQPKLMPASKQSRTNAAGRKHWRTPPECVSCKPSQPPFQFD